MSDQSTEKIKDFGTYINGEAQLFVTWLRSSEKKPRGKEKERKRKGEGTKRSKEAKEPVEYGSQEK